MYYLTGGHDRALNSRSTIKHRAFAQTGLVGDINLPLIFDVLGVLGYLLRGVCKNGSETEVNVVRHDIVPMDR